VHCSSICLVARNQPGTPDCKCRALRLHQAARSYKRTSHLYSSAHGPDTDGCDRYFLTSLYNESSDHIHSDNNSQIRHRLLQLILRSIKEIRVKENKKEANRKEFVLLSAVTDILQTKIKGDRTATINPNSIFILILRKESLGKRTKTFILSSCSP
jgi:hypothetical protein